MMITAQILKEMIENEIRIQSKTEVDREKESKKRSTDRKRSWDDTPYKLGKGIVESDSEINVSEESSPEELMRVILHLKKQNESLRTQLKSKMDLDSEQIQKFCNKNGMKSFKDYLKYVNAINSAEKGKLFQK